MSSRPTTPNIFAVNDAQFYFGGPINAATYYAAEVVVREWIEEHGPIPRIQYATKPGANDIVTTIGLVDGVPTYLDFSVVGHARAIPTRELVNAARWVARKREEESNGGSDDDDK